MIEGVLQSVQAAFADPATRNMLIFVGVLLVVAPLLFELTRLSGRASAELRKTLYIRYFAWLAIIPILVIPLLAGRLFIIGTLWIVALLGYREFSRATGLFRNHILSAVVVLGITLIFFSAADRWYNCFVALPTLVGAAIVVVAIFATAPDVGPKGYIQRVGLAVIGLLGGTCLGHTAYLANSVKFQAILLLVLLCVEINDVFAFTCGKLFGRRKLCPKVSPNKTIGGFVGAMVMTTALFVLLGRGVFAGTNLAHPGHLITMGLLVSVMGQLGDLVMSSIKRDIGVKDMGGLIPGHGGVLDRIDSLIFVGPVVFHYIGYHIGVGVGQPIRVFTGG